MPIQYQNQAAQNGMLQITQNRINLEKQNIVYLKIHEGNYKNDQDSQFIIEEPFDPFNQRRYILNDKDSQKFIGYNFELRWGTNFIKFYYNGNQKSQIISNLDQYIIQNLGFTFENVDYMQIISVHLNKSIREKNDHQKESKNVLNQEIHLINIKGNFSQEQFFPEIQTILQSTQAVKTTQQAYNALRYFGKFIRELCSISQYANSPYEMTMLEEIIASHSQSKQIQGNPIQINPKKQNRDAVQIISAQKQKKDESDQQESIKQNNLKQVQIIADKQEIKQEQNINLVKIQKEVPKIIQAPFKKEEIVVENCQQIEKKEQLKSQKSSDEKSEDSSSLYSSKNSSSSSNVKCLIKKRNTIILKLDEDSEKNCKEAEQNQETSILNQSQKCIITRKDRKLIMSIGNMNPEKPIIQEVKIEQAKRTNSQKAIIKIDFSNQQFKELITNKTNNQQELMQKENQQQLPIQKEQINTSNEQKVQVQYQLNCVQRITKEDLNSILIKNSDLKISEKIQQLKFTQNEKNQQIQQNTQSKQEIKPLLEKEIISEIKNIEQEKIQIKEQAIQEPSKIEKCESIINKNENTQQEIEQIIRPRKRIQHDLDEILQYLASDQRPNDNKQQEQVVQKHEDYQKQNRKKRQKISETARQIDYNNFLELKNQVKKDKQQLFQNQQQEAQNNAQAVDSLQKVDKINNEQNNYNPHDFRDIIEYKNKGRKTSISRQQKVQIQINQENIQLKEPLKQLQLNENQQINNQLSDLNINQEQNALKKKKTKKKEQILIFQKQLNNEQNQFESKLNQQKINLSNKEMKNGNQNKPQIEEMHGTNQQNFNNIQDIQNQQRQPYFQNNIQNNENKSTHNDISGGIVNSHQNIQIGNYYNQILTVNIHMDGSKKDIVQIQKPQDTNSMMQTLQSQRQNPNNPILTINGSNILNDEIIAQLFNNTSEDFEQKKKIVQNLFQPSTFESNKANNKIELENDLQKRLQLKQILQLQQIYNIANQDSKKNNQINEKEMIIEQNTQQIEQQYRCQQIMESKQNITKNENQDQEKYFNQKEGDELNKQQQFFKQIVQRLQNQIQEFEYKSGQSKNVRSKNHSCHNFSVSSNFAIYGETYNYEYSSENDVPISNNLQLQNQKIHIDFNKQDQLKMKDQTQLSQLIKQILLKQKNKIVETQAKYENNNQEIFDNKIYNILQVQNQNNNNENQEKQKEQLVSKIVQNNQLINQTNVDNINQLVFSLINNQNNLNQSTEQKQKNSKKQQKSEVTEKKQQKKRVRQSKEQLQNESQNQNEIKQKKKQGRPRKQNDSLNETSGSPNKIQKTFNFQSIQTNKEEQSHLQNQIYDDKLFNNQAQTRSSNDKSIQQQAQIPEQGKRGRPPKKSLQFLLPLKKGENFEHNLTNSIISPDRFSQIKFKPSKKLKIKMISQNLSDVKKEQDSVDNEDKQIHINQKSIQEGKSFQTNEKIFKTEKITGIVNKQILNLIEIQNEMSPSIIQNQNGNSSLLYHNYYNLTNNQQDSYLQNEQSNLQIQENQYSVTSKSKQKKLKLKKNESKKQSTQKNQKPLYLQKKMHQDMDLSQDSDQKDDFNIEIFNDSIQDEQNQNLKIKNQFSKSQVFNNKFQQLQNQENDQIMGQEQLNQNSQIIEQNQLAQNRDLLKLFKFDIKKTEQQEIESNSELFDQKVTPAVTRSKQTKNDLLSKQTKIDEIKIKDQNLRRSKRKIEKYDELDQIDDLQFNQQKLSSNLDESLYIDGLFPNTSNQETLEIIFKKKQEQIQIFKNEQKLNQQNKKRLEKQEQKKAQKLLLSKNSDDLICTENQILIKTKKKKEYIKKKQVLGGNQENVDKIIEIIKEKKNTVRIMKYKQNKQGNMDQDSQYELYQCQHYHNIQQQPYKILFTFEVQLIMYIHSYLSKNEVIGLLGGHIYETSIPILNNNQNEKVKYLVVSKIYPTESCVHNPCDRLKNCEISDNEQIRINNQIDKDGVQKLAWYHSHPFFQVDPSFLDLQTHNQYQAPFDQNNLPFFGVIIGPYFKNQDVSSTLFNVFSLREEKNLSKQGYNRLQKQKPQDKARSFQYLTLPQKNIKNMMYYCIKQMIKLSSQHKFDRPEFETDWQIKRIKTKHSYKEKFLYSLKKLCDQNLQNYKDNQLKNQIMKDLVSEQDRERFLNQLEDTAGTFRINQDDGLFEDENGFFMDSKQPLSDQSINFEDIRSEQMNQEINNKDDNIKVQNQSPSIQSNDKEQSNHQQFEQNLMNSFSVGNSVKISKLLIKIEQQLIKCFQLKGESIMNKLHEDKQNIIAQNDNQLKQQINQLNQIQSRQLQYEKHQQVYINDQQIENNNI